jgi:hypothetical protein
MSSKVIQAVDTLPFSCMLARIHEQAPLGAPRMGWLETQIGEQRLEHDKFNHEAGVVESVRLMREIVKSIPKHHSIGEMQGCSICAS